MPIDRAGPVPPYWQYIVESVLTPQQGPPNQALLNLQNANLRWLTVPTYQRGVSWGVEDVENFLRSDSVLLGNVILGQFAVPALRPLPLQYLPNGQTHYHVLVDGLQRLAVGTILLALLHDDYLAAAPNRPNDAHHFNGLTALVQSRAAAYLHNDNEFIHHPRKAIRDQYSTLRSALKSWIDEEASNNRINELAFLVTRVMTAKQVAIDVYFNFPGHLELMNTFLGLNTVRVDLGPIDLVRSYLVEKATSDGWNPADVEDLENEFTDIFTKDGRPDSDLLPFVNVVYDFLRDAQRVVKLFPSWSTSLDQKEVETFLQFVSDFKTPAAPQPYFDEIRRCGSLPFAVLLSYYYNLLINGTPAPSFLQGGANQNPELHEFLRAIYRVLIDGRIGRTGGYVRRALDGQYSVLSDIANAMSLEFLGVDLSVAVDPGWLRTSLVKADRNRSKRIFNAMLLPQRGAAVGGPFDPLPFGRKAVEYHIDHLIPEAMLAENTAGYPEGQTIRNFSPLPSNQNQAAKATSCSTKLGPGGIYMAYVTGGGLVHPYAHWLTHQHAPPLAANELDDQRYLEPNRVPAVGDDRLEHLAGELDIRL